MQPGLIQVKEFSDDLFTYVWFGSICVCKCILHVHGKSMCKDKGASRLNWNIMKTHFKMFFERHSCDSFTVLIPGHRRRRCADPE